MMLQIYICFIQVFLGNYRLQLDHKWKNFFDVFDRGKYSVEHRSVSQIVQKFPGELKSQGELKF